MHRRGRNDAAEPAARRRRGDDRLDDRRRSGGPVSRLRRDDPVRQFPVPLLDFPTDRVGAGMNRWFRLRVQTPFGLALFWLWVPTVSLPGVLVHAPVPS